MQIEKKTNPSVLSARYVAGHECPVAQQHLADLPTRLALMRWTRGGDIPHPPAPPREMWRRAAWYNELQTEFQSWLQEGGFHATDIDDAAGLHGLNVPPGSDGRVTAISTAAKRRRPIK